MRKLFLLFVILLMFEMTAFAGKTIIVNKTQNFYSNQNYYSSEDCASDIEGGIGLDAKLYDFNKNEKTANSFLDSINFEARKDLVDIEHTSFYLVLTTDFTK